MTLGYCMKCKKKVEMEREESKPTPNGMKMIKGYCPDCQTRVCRIQK